MKKIYPFLLLLCLVASCKPEPTFRIEGTMADETCNGSKVYLVPVIGPQTSETVDSVVIENGKFHFEGVKEQVSVLRLEMRHRLNHQELLLVTEPGVIKAHIAKIGSVTGTPQNDRLQAWKEQHEEYTTYTSQWYSKWRESKDSVDYRRYRATSDSLQQEEVDYTYRMLQAEGNSTLGSFFYNNFKSRLTDEQREALKATGLGE